MERFGHKNGLQHTMRSAGAFDPVNADAAVRWLATTDCRVIVFVEIPRTSPLFELCYPADNSAILTTMKAQTAFPLAHRETVRNLGTVWVWER